MAYLSQIAEIIDRRTLLSLIGLSLVASLLEAASVSAVIPAIQVILSDHIPPILTSSLGMIGIVSPIHQKLAVIAATCFIFTFRATILSGTLFLQSRLIFNTQSRLSSEIYQKYIASDFEKQCRLSSANLTNTTTTELYNLTLGVLMPFATLSSELALVFGSLLVLFIIDPIGAVSLFGVLSLLALPVLKLNSRYLSRLGIARHQMEGDRARFAQEIVSGAREIKVYRMDSQLLSSIELTNSVYARVMARINFLQNFPRIYLEASGTAVLLAICAVQLLKGKTSAEILTFLMLSGLAAFRALPSLSKILAQLQALRFYRPALDQHIKMLSDLAVKDAGPTTGSAPGTSKRESLPNEPVKILVRNASYSYELNSPPIFQNASFEIKAGEIIGLIGPSGIGKSTLLDCIIGLRKPTGGTVSILGHSSDKPIPPNISYVPQNPVIFDGSIWRNLTLEENSDTTTTCLIKDNLNQALAISGFGEFMRENNFDFSHHIIESGRNLSGGQKQRLALTRALARGGNILILDEATGALDANSEDLIYEKIRENLGSSIAIVVTHRKQLTKFCDRVIEIQPGGNIFITLPHA